MYTELHVALSQSSFIPLNFYTEFFSFLNFIILPRYQSRHLAPSTPRYSKVVSIVRSFILSIFGGSVDWFSDHRSISPISSRRFNSSVLSIFNGLFSPYVIWSQSNATRDIVPTFCKVGNVGAIIGASVGKITVFSWGVTLSTKWSNSSWEVNAVYFRTRDDGPLQ